MRVWIAVWTGSSALAGRVGEWLRRGIALRLLGVLLAAGFVKGLPWTTQIAGLAAGGWLVAAIVLGLRLPMPGAAPAEEPAEPSGEPLPDAAALAAALHEVGAPHAHLAVLADHMGRSPGHVREALTAAGIPIGPCRMKGRGSSTGVKAEDFPPLPSPTSDAPEGVVAAGQSDNNNARVRRWPWGHTVTNPAERLHHAVTKTP
ncbi:hypothetical protein ACFVZH_22490 [Streptomyces sp. NPDC059534]|uniref:hypothetical protein n=1 Tax=Streptomyces sp. NPDC059534 TaxID=3346859 RepID=UPI00369938D7